MSVANFIPEVWSTKIQRTLENALVYGGPRVVNRDHEGEISGAGDTLRISSIGAITISDYTRNTDLTAAEALTSAQAVLEIDQSKAFNFQVDDADAAQVNAALLAAATKKAAYGLANEADAFIAGEMVDDSTDISGDVDTTPTVTSGATTFYENLVIANIALKEANAPMDEEWFAVIPSWLTGQLQRDTRFIGVANSGTTDALVNGFVARAAGFNLFESNNVPVSGQDYSVVAGTRSATTFAQQVNKVEAYRMEKRFADAVKGLQLYGAKVIEPASLVSFTQTRP